MNGALGPNGRARRKRRWENIEMNRVVGFGRLAAWLSAAIVGLGMGACGDGSIGDGQVIDLDGAETTPGDTDSPDAAGDTATDTNVADVPDDLETPDVVDPDVGPDDVSDAADGADGSDTIDPGPDGRCPALSACDQPLVDGRCESQCRDVDGSLVCRGRVIGGLCDMTEREPATWSMDPIDFGDFTITPVAIPERMTVGETAPFEFRIRNNTAETLDLPFSWKHPGYWSITNASWGDATGFRLAPGVAVALTATLTAVRTTLFDTGSPHIASFNIARNAWEPTSVIDVDDADAIVCGGKRFPMSWCADDDCSGRQRYFQGRCCDEVFYPAAQCCVDADCQGGQCADGRCITRAPMLGSANNLPAGNQRIVLVLVDSHPEFSDDPCADRVDIVAEPLQLATVDNWYHTIAMKRLGRETMATKWTVLGGINTSDFLVGEDRFWYNFSANLDTWLADRGCPILGEYDKVLVSAPTLDLTGFGGIYFSKGEIGLVNPYNPHLIAHELAHSFGATDLYLDLAGTFHYARDLMGNWLYPPPEPGDAVAWSEMGFGDVDADGVVDIASHMAFPEALIVSEPTAIITGRNTLEVSFEVRGVAGDDEGRVTLPTVSYAVEGSPMAGEIWVQGTRHLVVFDAQQVDIAAAEAAGTFVMHVSGAHTFTNAAWEAETLVIDEAVSFPVSRAQ